ncbi:hypothetical protein L596_005132 [Steinernema carpocapsae]|uniref:Uncharacterized protein n=1 Tax=Steinernema carpocapsae TaxID=34508 RepID=A0A4U8UZI2_STECR|nr:hypothetical protein L596_005132 [Steinernema carpocapsae]
MFNRFGKAEPKFSVKLPQFIYVRFIYVRRWSDLENFGRSQTFDRDFLRCQEPLKGQPPTKKLWLKMTGPHPCQTCNISVLVGVASRVLVLFAFFLRSCFFVPDVSAGHDVLLTARRTDDRRMFRRAVVGGPSRQASVARAHLVPGCACSEGTERADAFLRTPTTLQATTRASERPAAERPHSTEFQPEAG